LYEYFHDLRGILECSAWSCCRYCSCVWCWSYLHWRFYSFCCLWSWCHRTQRCRVRGALAVCSISATASRQASFLALVLYSCYRMLKKPWRCVCVCY